MAITKLIINDQELTFSRNKDFFDVTFAGEQNKEQQVQVTVKSFDKASGLLIFCVNGSPCKAYVTTDGTQWYVALAHITQEFVIQPARELFESIDTSPSAALRKNGQKNPFVVRSPLSLSKGTDGNFIPAKQSGHDQMLKSPLAGRVTRVLVSVGQQVAAGQPLLLIESMKMENEICAQSAVFIKTILIAEANVVQPNQILMEFGKEGDGNAAPKSPHEQKAVSHR